LNQRHSGANGFLDTFRYVLSQGRLKEAAFHLHQAIEHGYATLLLVLTNYSPPSHKLTFLRALAEEQDRRLAEAWPRDQQRYRAWFNTLNEASSKRGTQSTTTLVRRHLAGSASAQQNCTGWSKRSAVPTWRG
jgi:hypothetical protein